MNEYSGKVLPALDVARIVLIIILQTRISSKLLFLESLIGNSDDWKSSVVKEIRHLSDLWQVTTVVSVSEHVGKLTPFSSRSIDKYLSSFQFQVVQRTSE